MARTETASVTTAIATPSQRRVVLARLVLGLLRRALPADSPLELVLAGRAFDLRRLSRALPLLARRGFELRPGAAPTPSLGRVAHLSRRRHSRARDLAIVRFHYDVGNGFYAPWLDRRLGVFVRLLRDARIDARCGSGSQARPHLPQGRLGRGMRLPEIGCGWGSLVAFAVERYGVEATGITLSAAEAEWAVTEIRRRDSRSGDG